MELYLIARAFNKIQMEVRIKQTNPKGQPPKWKGHMLYSKRAEPNRAYDFCFIMATLQARCGKMEKAATSPGFD